MAFPAASPVVTEPLCASFGRAADALARRRPEEIPQVDLENFEALRWMDRRGGSLRVTPLGHMALIRIRARIEAAA